MAKLNLVGYCLTITLARVFIRPNIERMQCSQSSCLEELWEQMYGAMAGASASAGFTDSEKFYDSLDPAILVTQLIKFNFPPPVSLLLHLQAHWGHPLHSGGHCEPLLCGGPQYSGGLS